MAQVGIVRINDQYFREYKIDQGDNLWTICMRYGHRDYQTVYNLSVNDEFRNQFGNPHQIDFIYPNLRLYIPLPGGPVSGRSYRGKPIEDYVVANITDANGAPLDNTPIKLISPSSPTGDQIETTAQGDVLISNPEEGQLSLVSTDYMLLDSSVLSVSLTPNEIDLTQDQIEFAPPISLQYNGIKHIAARKMFAVECPMCGRTWRVVENVPPEALPKCPNDDFDLHSLITAIQTDPESFISSPEQDPTTDQNNLIRRGISSNLNTIYGAAQIYWDESRFFIANGGDYSLWEPVNGKIDIRGRQTWNARPPKIEPGRNYLFHEAGLNAADNWPYTVMAIPSSGEERLKTVLRWITVHHTANLSVTGNGAPQEIQDEHIDVGIGPWHSKSPAADMAYHFVIDPAGTVYEGRPLGISGSHVDDFNSGNVGIVLSGNFEVEEGDSEHSKPTQEAKSSLDHLVDAIAKILEIDSVFGHQHRDRQKGVPLDDATECPGQRLIPHVENTLRPKYPGQGEPTFE